MREVAKKKLKLKHEQIETAEHCAQSTVAAWKRYSTNLDHSMRAAVCVDSAIMKSDEAFERGAPVDIQNKNTLTLYTRREFTS